MSDYEITFNAVHKVTGISKTKICSRSRVWPVHEARMLFVLWLSRQGHDDQRLAWTLDRNRSTICKTRSYAEDYIKISSSFHDKYKKIAKLYEVGKIPVS